MDKIGITGCIIAFFKSADKEAATGVALDADAQPSDCFSREMWRRKFRIQSPIRIPGRHRLKRIIHFLSIATISQTASGEAPESECKTANSDFANCTQGFWLALRCWLSQKTDLVPSEKFPERENMDQVTVRKCYFDKSGFGQLEMWCEHLVDVFSHERSGTDGNENATWHKSVSGVNISDVEPRKPDVQMHRFHVVRLVGIFERKMSLRGNNLIMSKQSITNLDSDGMRANKSSEVKLYANKESETGNGEWKLSVEKWNPQSIFVEQTFKKKCD
jgi:hypothetical protein